MERVETTPDVEEIRQYDKPVMQTVPVEIKAGSGYVTVLPSRRGNQATYTLATVSANATPPEVVAGDPRIKRAIFVASANTVYVGELEQVMAPNGPYGFLMPANLAITFEGFEEPLYAVATSGTPTLSVRYEYWAD